MPQPIVLNAGTEDEMRIPARNEVCAGCEGDGRQDAWTGAMTAGEFAEQGDEFAEDYLAGRYDVPCRECNGRGLVVVVDEERATPEQLDALAAWEAVRWEMRAEMAAERAAGC